MGDKHPRTRLLADRRLMVNGRPDGIFSPTANLLVAARAALGLTAAALSEEARLGVNTIRRAEAGGLSVLTPANAERLVATLERLGVIFLPADETGAAGLRVRPKA